MSAPSCVGHSKCFRLRIWRGHSLSRCRENFPMQGSGPASSDESGRENEPSFQTKAGGDIVSAKIITCVACQRSRKRPCLSRCLGDLFDSGGPPCRAPHGVHTVDTPRSTTRLGTVYRVLSFRNWFREAPSSSSRSPSSLQPAAPKQANAPTIWLTMSSVNEYPLLCVNVGPA